MATSGSGRNLHLEQNKSTHNLYQPHTFRFNQLIPTLSPIRLNGSKIGAEIDKKTD
jgi:hypothetical protein